jgi:hypothetical protein
MRLRNTLAILLLLSLAFSGVLGVKWQQAERRAAATTRWTEFVIDSLGTTLSLPPPPIEPWGRDSVYWQWVAVSARLQSRRWQLAVQHWAQARGTLLNDSDINFLREKGLIDPPRQLRDSLNAHPELIPFDPVLGGTMFFDDIAVLQYPFVFAGFEDGHIDGSMLLEYDIVSDRPIRWKRLWARLN